uniref:PilW family protein n=1 Tax=Marinobacterium profundum TaxID=1714300 RepID=UPI0013151CBB|nr:prepilin-type N-terminal cleavage/methylation domain-containing protein [Marinobacterium profundum]
MRARQRGMSLIELMISMLIGLVLIMGVVQALMMSRTAIVSQASMSAISENARVSFELMKRELRLAGLNATSTSWLSFAQVDDTDHGNAWVLSAEGGGSTVEYWVNADNELVYRRDSDIPQALVDGITGLDVTFGVGDPADGSVQYVGQSDIASVAQDNIWALRIELALNDPQDNGSELHFGQRSISSTVALRNPLLNAVAGITTAPAAGGGGSGTGDDDGVTGGSDSGDSGGDLGGDSGGDSSGGEAPGGSDGSGDSGSGSGDTGTVASCSVTANGSVFHKNASIKMTIDGLTSGSCSNSGGSNPTYTCSGGPYSEGVYIVLTATQGQSKTTSLTLDCAGSSSVTVENKNL